MKGMHVNGNIVKKRKDFSRMKISKLGYHNRLSGGNSNICLSWVSFLLSHLSKGRKGENKKGRIYVQGKKSILGQAMKNLGLLLSRLTSLSVYLGKLLYQLSYRSHGFIKVFFFKNPSPKTHSSKHLFIIINNMIETSPHKIIEDLFFLSYSPG